MGSCISWLWSSRSKSSKYSAAYRKDLCAKLLEESASELSAKAIVLIIKVKSIERLPQVQRKSSILGLPTYLNCNCFLEMKLLRGDTAISGVQLQRGLIGNFNFIWVNWEDILSLHIDASIFEATNALYHHYHHNHIIIIFIIATSTSSSVSPPSLVS